MLCYDIYVLSWMGVINTARLLVAKSSHSIHHASRPASRDL